MSEFFEIMNTDLCEVEDWFIFKDEILLPTEDEFTAWIEHIEEELEKDLKEAFYYD